MNHSLQQSDKSLGSPYWSPSRDIHINGEGKHVIKFSDDFPLCMKLVSLHYDHKLTPNYHDYLELTIIYDGRGIFHIRNKSYNIFSGDLVIISVGELHTFTADYEQPLRLLSVFFLPELYYRPGQDMFDFELIRPILNKDTDEIDYLPRKVFEGIHIQGLFTSMYEDTVSKTVIGRLHAKNMLSLILIEILKQHMNVPASKRKKYEKREKGSERLTQVFRLVNERYSERVTLDEAAEAACMSPTYFCRFFKKVTGNTFTEYVMRLRIDMAKKLLLSHEHSTKTVAYLVGFDNISYFYRIFHRLTNLKPSEFVEKHRNVL
jgi:AraC family transcriptional regulator, transcriptional activator of pobA